MSDVTSNQVRRPAERTELMDSLLRSPTQPHGAFKTYRDAMVFAAALGWEGDRKVEFTQSASPIEWSTMINRFGTEELVDLIAYSDTQDVEILAPERLGERIRIFESYANGGLEVIDEVMQREALTPAEALQRLTRRELTSDQDDPSEAPSIRELGKALGFD